MAPAPRPHVLGCGERRMGPDGRRQVFVSGCFKNGWFHVWGGAALIDADARRGTDLLAACASGVAMGDGAAVARADGQCHGLLRVALIGADERRGTDPFAACVLGLAMGRRAVWLCGCVAVWLCGCLAV